MTSRSYAYYRLPYADTYTMVESEQPPVQLESLDEVGSMPGFVIAPFQSTDDCPALLISADSTTTRRLLPAQEGAQQTPLQEITSPDSPYSYAFDAFHRAVEKRDFVKLVLARKKVVALAQRMELDDPVSMRPLFERACRLYPRLMVMLYSTPLSGTWLVASPEILLDGKGRSLHTVALAGTMQFREGLVEWSEKNRHEQNIVEQYIEHILGQVSSDVLKDGPVTMRAGNLVHLRTDFRFHLAPKFTVGSLVRNLHPTPAVCGMPMHEAADFISRHEGLDRRYYSGFSGPVDIEGETHLYVSLRCAELTETPDGTEAVLYAGGGIMPESDCNSEWLETESKMRTIQYVLQ